MKEKSILKKSQMYLAQIHIWLFRGQAQLSFALLVAKHSTLLGAGEGDMNDYSNIAFNNNGATWEFLDLTGMKC